MQTLEDKVMAATTKTGPEAEIALQRHELVHLRSALTSAIAENDFLQTRNAQFLVELGDAHRVCDGWRELAQGRASRAVGPHMSTSISTFQFSTCSNPVKRDVQIGPSVTVCLHCGENVDSTVEVDRLQALNVKYRLALQDALLELNYLGPPVREGHRARHREVVDSVRAVLAEGGAQ